MILRPYRPSDLQELVELFYDTVHTVNAGDYTAEQLDAWADGAPDFAEWNRTLLEHTALVAVEGEALLGFGDIDASGYLDRLYVHKDFQRQGVASALCGALERAVEGERTAWAMGGPIRRTAPCGRPPSAAVMPMAIPGACPTWAWPPSGEKRPR